MPSDPIDITVVLNGHREGMLIHRTLRSVLRAVEFAQQGGLRCEILAVLDQPDHETLDYFGRVHLPILKTVVVDCGDPGIARNHGITESAGTCVAFVDGDDLISRNWLREAFVFYQHQIQHFGQLMVLHPEANVFFGAELKVLQHLDQESGDWSFRNLFSWNYWTALAFAPRTVFVGYPYRPAIPGSGFAFEDWDWNCLTVGAGIVHKVVAGTWHFIRVKTRDSRGVDAKGRNSLLRASPMFDRLENLPVETPFPASSPADNTGGFEDSQLRRIFASSDLMSEWRDLAQIEPELFPSKDRLARYRLAPVPTPSVARAGEIFGELLRHWGEAPSHVILCDRIDQGDAGTAALSYARALSESGATVTIVTEETPHSQLSATDRGVLKILEFSKLCAGVAPPWMLARVFLQRPPGTIHIVESALGFEAVAAYGPAISQGSRIFASIFHTDLAEDGERSGSAVSDLVRIAPCLTGLIGDSGAIIDWFCGTYGYPRQRCHVVRAALPRFVSRKLVRKGSPAVQATALWVGDLGRQACPSMLLRIAQLMPDWTFVIFQQAVSRFPWTAELDAALKALPNARWAKKSSGLADVIEDAGALLYTSLTDGLPRVLIEAATGGLPIVAPALAGICEFVGEESGYLVSDFHRPDAYVAQLRQMQLEPEERSSRVGNAKKKLRQDHSWGHFVDALTRIDGYC